MKVWRAGSAASGGGKWYLSGVPLTNIWVGVAQTLLTLCFSVAGNSGGKRGKPIPKLGFPYFAMYPCMVLYIRNSNQTTKDMQLVNKHNHPKHPTRLRCSTRIDLLYRSGTYLFYLLASLHLPVKRSGFSIRGSPR